MSTKTRRKEVRLVPNLYQPTKAEVEPVEPPLNNADGSVVTLEQIARSVLEPVTLITTEHPKSEAA
ncbi:MAG: hypothetical protein OXI69_06985 [Acidobacteriota bacterium]|nr:hypothetical protein [Acidobacteriota bacterium]